MSSKLVKPSTVLLIVATMVVTVWPSAHGKRDDSANENQHASIYGEAGERYDLFGTGGITVDQSPRPGWIHSNMKSYRIQIDGSAMSGQTGGSFNAINEEASFDAAATCAYFVSHNATCTLPSAADVAGKEVSVCNKGGGISITYATKSGETISGNQSGTLVNSTPYQVDRFISDGRNWYKE